MPAETVLITGASGFLGGHLARDLYTRGIKLCLAGRNVKTDPGLDGASEIIHGNLDGTTNWQSALHSIDALVHCAGFAHADASRKNELLHQQINYEASINLARQAASAGVRRFIYISSIKVNGERSLPERPFTAEDAPHPECAYGRAKHQAEQSLLHLAQNSVMDVVILRPCLIYGPGVKANFYHMLRALAVGLPLPLASVKNMRSYISVENLTDLIAVCLKHPAAANQIYLASDDKDFSTPDLLRCLARPLGRSARLMHCPLPVLNFAAKLAGQQQRLDRLTSWLQVDTRKTHERLGWQPPYSADECLVRTAEAFLCDTTK